MTSVTNQNNDIITPVYPPRGYQEPGKLTNVFSAVAGVVKNLATAIGATMTVLGIGSLFNVAAIGAVAIAPIAIVVGVLASAGHLLGNRIEQTKKDKDASQIDTMRMDMKVMELSLKALRVAQKPLKNVVVENGGGNLARSFYVANNLKFDENRHAKSNFYMSEKNEASGKLIIEANRQIELDLGVKIPTLTRALGVPKISRKR